MAALITRKERWVLSSGGWVVLLGLLGLAILCFFANICSFLAPTDRVRADILVVEGWIPEHLVGRAADEFKFGNYRQLFTTGGPWTRPDPDWDKSRTWAQACANRLERAGVPKTALRAVPCQLVGRDRTFASAVALRDWFDANNLHVEQINVLTEGLHARRTRLLFNKAFGTKVAVGIIALPTGDSDLDHWWRYSESAKDVFGETFGYLYSAVLFHPAVPSQREVLQSPVR